MKIKNIHWFSFVYVLCLALVVQSCSKVEHELQTPVVSFNEGTVTTSQLGNALKVGFIANKVSEFNFSIISGDNELLSEVVSVDPNTFIINKEFSVPNEEQWLGDAELKLSYQSDGQLVEKTHAITFTESNPEMFIVGGSTGAGWEPTLAVPMWIYDAESKTKFEIYEYITMNGDGFKFLPTNQGWENAFGAGATAGTLMQTGDAGNITVESDGFYRVRMDAEALTYEVLETSWGVVGSATPGGWDTDTDMTFDGTKGSYVWKVTMTLQVGDVKFRANDDWPINYGGDVNNLTLAGDNIAITEAGTYDIELNLHPSGFTAKINKK